MYTYPIQYHTKTVGTLERTADGLYTVFTARCDLIAPRLRLTVFGDGGCAYLGLMLPENGALYLQKRLTRLQMTSFPDPIRYAAEEASPPPRTDADWRRASDGTLRRAVGDGEEIAVPVSMVRAPGIPKQLLQMIDGREYLVFPL